MKYNVTLHGDGDDYIAECPDLGLSVRAMSPSNALDALKEEIRYNIEFCPCTTVGDDFIELNVRG